MSRPRRRPCPSRSAFRFAAVIGCLLLGASPGAVAQELLTPAPEPLFPVSHLTLRYAQPHPDHPELDALLPVEVPLARDGDHWTAGDEEGAAAAEPLRFDATPGEARRLDPDGLVALLAAVVEALHGAGYYGVDVRPAESDIDLATEKDLRATGQTGLSVVVRIGRIGRVRTVAVGDRIRSDWKIDNELHERIRLGSPLQPLGVGEDKSDLLDRDALEDYLHRLNRHSGRRVEAALAPGEEPGEVVLDYRVAEAKPWYVYAQGANTGTARTNLWQQRYGVSHRQLTNRDDVFHFEYMNTGFDDVNAVSARYQAPWFGGERPSWMNRRRGDPEWYDWIPRDKLPWWGVDRLRWEIDFRWSKAEVGDAATFLNLANDSVRSETFQYGGRFLYEIFQHKNFFIDLWSGLRMRHLDVENTLIDRAGNAILVEPRIGLHAERFSLLSNFQANVSVSGQVNGIDTSNRDNLGRADTAERHAQLNFDASYSAYLEPLLNPDGWLDPETQLTSTLAHEIAFSARGQHTFDDQRVIPQANGSLGGLYSVRGYPQSVAVGDDIYVGSFEYRFHLPRALPVSRKPLAIPLVGDFRASPQQVYSRPDWDFILRGFVDAGYAIRNSGGLAIPEEDQLLVSAGVGAELQILSNIRARIDYAVALEDEEAVGNAATDNRVNAGNSEIHVLFSIVY